MDEIHAQKAKLALIYMAVIMAFVFSGWGALLNNFAIEKVAFNGEDMGHLQSFREIPGFLAFTAIYILLFLREQTLAIVALAFLCVGVLATGYFPTKYGMIATTLIMSIGFHYFETINSSISIQWLSKSEAPAFLGKVIGISSFAGLVSYGAIWLFYKQLGFDYVLIYTIFGSIGLAMVVHLWLIFPKLESKVPQKKELFLKQRYWVFYVLTFLKGARRQIFTVFAAFLLVEKFGYSVDEVVLLYLINKAANIFFAPVIGKLIAKIGERRTLTVEYLGLIAVFIGYALINDPIVAAGLYILDHLFFAMAIGIKTYFQKIADSEDIAATASVSFTIDHIAAVIVPTVFGMIWMINPSFVFYAGAGFAFLSLIASNLIPLAPAPGNEFVWSEKKQAAKI